MSTAPVLPAEVLRGMHVERTPLQLGRARQGADPAAGAVASQRPEDAALEEARRRAAEEAARQGHEEGLRAGYEAGLRKGLAEAGSQVQAAVQKAEAKASAELQTQRQKLESLAGELQVAMRDVLAAAEDEMVALCFETLCIMLGSTGVDEDAVRKQLLGLAHRAQPGEVLALHVHPDDLGVLCAAATSGIPWVGDPQVRVGGCILRRKGGGLDVRLDSMLEACKTALLAARAQRASAGAQSS